MRTIWGPLGYGGFVTERRLDPGKYFILQMLAAREPSAEAFLARLDTLRQTIRVHTDAPDARLTLSTIHSSKGLEYEQVYLLDIHDGVLPSRPDAADGTADERREYEEDRRLFYVAMTRAKDELTLFDYPDAPSAFIREAQGYLPVPVRAKDDFAAIVRKTPVVCVIATKRTARDAFWRSAKTRCSLHFRTVTGSCVRDRCCLSKAARKSGRRREHLPQHRQRRTRRRSGRGASSGIKNTAWAVSYP